jgi:hypothetical protein
MLAGFERFNREIQALLHSMSLQKRKRELFVGDISRLCRVYLTSTFLCVNGLEKGEEVVGDVTRLVGLQPTHQPYLTSKILPLLF